MSEGSAAVTEQPAVEPLLLRTWHTGIAPRAISLFLLILFFNKIAGPTLAVGGLIPSILGALAGGALFTLLVFLPMSLWGYKSGRGFVDLCALAFGSRSTRWLIEPLSGAVAVAWFAVAIACAASLTLQGLALIGLVPRSAFVPVNLGGVELGGGLPYIFTATVWAFAAALLGPPLIRVVAAVLYGYAVFPAVALGGVMLWSLFVREPTQVPLGDSWAGAFMAMTGIVFSYALVALVVACDWGAGSPQRKDVLLGGLVGFTFAPAIIASLALLSVLNLTESPSPPFLHPSKPMVYSETVFRSEAIGGWAGWGITTIHALLLLGPCCYAPAFFRDRFHRLAPRAPKAVCVLGGVVVALPLILGGWALRIPEAFQTIALVLAPLGGVLAAAALVMRPGASPASGFGFSAWFSFGFSALAGTWVYWQLQDPYFWLVTLLEMVLGWVCFLCLWGFSPRAAEAGKS